MSKGREFVFEGHDQTNNVCTSTVLRVSDIDQSSYGDNMSENEMQSFKDGKITYLRLEEPIKGFARNYGGDSHQNGLFIHNRTFKNEESSIEHLYLNETKNTGEKMCLVELDKGARLAVGFIEKGKGMQARISNQDKVKTGYIDLSNKNSNKN